MPRRLSALLSTMVVACAGAPAQPPRGDAVAVPVASVDAGCTDGRPAVVVPDLPKIPEIPDVVAREGDALTVAGAIHALRSRFEAEEVTKDEITVVGWVVDTNVPSAPKCALHRAGKADPPDCAAELPELVLADRADAPKGAPRLRVMGWASSFAQLVEAEVANGKKPAKPYADDVWGVPVPWPLPAPGARVKVRGRYGFSFTKSSRRVVTDATSGILTYAGLETLSPAPRPLLIPR